MAPRKKNQTTAEQTAREQTDAQEEQTAQEQTDGQEDQTGQEQTAREQTDAQEEQTAQEQTDGQEDQTGQEQTGQEQERDEFADIPNPCVYCGPSVRGVARQYTTYQGGIPDPLKEFIKEHPAVRGLIVPASRFAIVRKRLETRGTAESIIYKKVKDEL